MSTTLIIGNVADDISGYTAKFVRESIAKKDPNILVVSALNRGAYVQKGFVSTIIGESGADDSARKDLSRVCKQREALKAYDAIIFDSVGAVLPLLLPSGAVSQPVWGAVTGELSMYILALKNSGVPLYMTENHVPDDDDELRPQSNRALYNNLLVYSDSVHYVYATMEGNNVVQYAQTNKAAAVRMVKLPQHVS